MAVHYVDSVAYASIPQWSNGAAKVVGNLVRQLAAPSVGNERVFICVTAGITGGSEPSWGTTAGASTNDNTVVWREKTGHPALNNDMQNVSIWTPFANQSVTAGTIIKNNALTHLFIATTGGTAGAVEPTWDTTTGNSTTDNTVTWKCIGAVGAYSNGQAPHARLGNAHANGWATNDDHVYVKNSHAETGTLGTITFRGTVSAPTKTFCHNGGAYPPAAANLTTGAVVTSSSGTFTITGHGYVQGVEFEQSAAAVMVLASLSMCTFRDCHFTLSNNSTTPEFQLGLTTVSFGLRFLNCTFEFAHTGQLFALGQSTIEWLGGSVIGTSPGLLFRNNAGASNVTILSVFGVDFSAVDTDVLTGGTYGGLTAKFMNCKFSASTSLTGLTNSPSANVQFVNCESFGGIGDEYCTYQGTVTRNTTVRMIGGASDGDEAYAWIISMFSTVEPIMGPLVLPPIRKYLTSANVGSPITVEVDGIAGSVPNNDQVWLEVEYPGDASSPLSSFVSDGLATPLSTSTPQDASSQVWTGSVAPFKLSVTFTPMRQGWITARVHIGSAAATWYINPQITVV